MVDIHSQYRIIAGRAGWIERGRGRLRFEGQDRVSFLQALVSNDIAAAAPGTGVYATWLTPQGRMITDLRMYVRPDALLAEVAPGLAAELTARLEGLIFTEDVRVSDISAAFAALTVVGAQAAGVIAGALGLDEQALSSLGGLAQIDAPESTGGGFVVRTDDANLPSFDVWLPAGARDGVIAAFADAGLPPISHELFGALRIEAGRPLFGVDMTSETIPLEAGLLERGISTSKGCYVGQEVIIRVLHRGGGRVAKRLVKLVFDADVRDVPDAGAVIEADGKQSGRLTSTSRSPVSDRVIALGYVHRDAAEPGRKVIVRTEAGGRAAEITALAG